MYQCDISDCTENPVGYDGGCQTCQAEKVGNLAFQAGTHEVNRYSIAMNFRGADSG